MKKIIFSFFFLLITSYSLLVTSPVSAVVCNALLDPSCTGTQANNPKAYANSVFQGIFSIFMLVGVIYSIWYFVMAGYHLITSEGDEKKFMTAKHQITYSLLGLGVVFSVFAILKFVGIILNIPGLEKLELTWPSL